MEGSRGGDYPFLKLRAIRQQTVDLQRRVSSRSALSVTLSTY